MTQCCHCFNPSFPLGVRGDAVSDDKKVMTPLSHEHDTGLRPSYLLIVRHLHNQIVFSQL